MDWSVPVDAYCERLGTGLWAEPMNAVSNAAFLIAAVAAWQGSAGVPVARALSAVLFAIGIGSGLFHTAATRWAAVADVIPIAAFVVIYVWSANRHLLGLSPAAATAATVLYIPAHAALAAPMSALPVVGVSGAYLPVPVAILAYALVLRRARPTTAAGLAAGAGVLGVSILLRSLDAGLCPRWPLGTHFLWHLLNAAMLWWMIRVLVRAMPALRGRDASPSIGAGGALP